MKPRLTTPQTPEDFALWVQVCRRFYRRSFCSMTLYHASGVADRRDALIMLGRGVHIAQAARGRILYWRPAHWWVAADGSVGFNIALAYTGNLG